MSQNQATTLSLIIYAFLGFSVIAFYQWESLGFLYASAGLAAVLSCSAFLLLLYMVKNRDKVLSNAIESMIDNDDLTNFVKKQSTTGVELPYLVAGVLYHGFLLYMSAQILWFIIPVVAYAAMVLLTFGWVHPGNQRWVIKNEEYIRKIYNRNESANKQLNEELKKITDAIEAALKSQSTYFDTEQQNDDEESPDEPKEG